MATFLTDTFTDTAGTTLASHTRDDAGSWTLHPTAGSNSQISSSGTKLHGSTANSTSLYYASGTPASADYDVECVLLISSTTASIAHGPCVRLDTTAHTGYHVRYNIASQIWQLYKMSTGTLTLLDSWSESVPLGAYRYVFFHCTDAEKSVYINGVKRLTTANNDITAAGRAGIRLFTATGVTLSNMSFDYIKAADSLTMQPAFRLVATAGMTDSGAGAATDGEEVETWTDQNPLPTVITSTSAGRRPRLVIDDGGAVVRSGSDAMATSAAILGSVSEFTWTVVVRKPTLPTSTETLASEGNTGSANQTRRFDVNTNGTVTFTFKDSAGTDVFPDVTSTTNICDDEPHVITVHSTGGTLALRIDGTQEDSDAEGTHVLSSTTFNALGIFHQVSTTATKYASCDLYAMECHATPVSNVATHDAQFVYANPSNLLVSRGAGSSLYTSAIRYSNTYDRTYIGWADPYGRIGITQIQNSTGAKSHYQIDSGLSVNRHNSVALAVRSDHKLLAFWCNHNDGTLYQYTATNAEDASAWGSATSIEATSADHAYIQTATTTEGSNSYRIYVYYRNETNKYWEYISSDDNGATWSGPTIFWDPTGTTDAQLYLSVYDAGSRTYFAATNGDPSGTTPGTVDLYYFYYDGAWKNGAGSSQTLPITEAKSTLVFDSSANSNQHPYFTYSMRESGGNLLMGFSAVDEVTGDRGSYRLTINGASVTQHTALSLGAATTRLNTTCLDPFDDNSVYYDKSVSGEAQLVKATTSDGGSTWSETQLTTGDHHGIGVFQGPQPIFQPHSTIGLVWKQGLVNSDTDFSENFYFRGVSVPAPPPFRPKPVRFFRR